MIALWFGVLRIWCLGSGLLIWFGLVVDCLIVVALFVTGCCGLVHNLRIFVNSVVVAVLVI